MINDPSIKREFSAGERVFLAEGPYTCTVGNFLEPCGDAAWGRIQEPKKIGTHPIRWMRHCPDGNLDWTELLGTQPIVPRV